MANIGGIVSYFYEIQASCRAWSITGFALHIVVSVFLGYLASLLVAGLGYDVAISIAAAGGVDYS